MKPLTQYALLIFVSFQGLNKVNCQGVECGRREFACADGSKCLPLWMFCDGYYQCWDLSDEVRRDLTLNETQDGIPCRGVFRTCMLPTDQIWKKPPICRKHVKCKNYEFECADGSGCLPAWVYCSGLPECKDKSDELYYKRREHTPEDGTPCRAWHENHVCLLPPSQNSKFNEICRGGSYCRPDEFACTDGSLCFPSHAFCDGLVACFDGSDEIPYDAEKFTSEDGEQCQGRYSYHRVCLLPADQVHNRMNICTGGRE